MSKEHPLPAPRWISASSVAEHDLSLLCQLPGPVVWKWLHWVPSSRSLLTDFKAGRSCDLTEGLWSSPKILFYRAWPLLEAECPPQAQLNLPLPSAHLHGSASHPSSPVARQRPSMPSRVSPALRPPVIIPRPPLSPLLYILIWLLLF